VHSGIFYKKWMDGIFIMKYESNGTIGKEKRGGLLNNFFKTTNHTQPANNNY